jgi:hypothetical protein
MFILLQLMKVALLVFIPVFVIMVWIYGARDNVYASLCQFFLGSISFIREYMSVWYGFKVGRVHGQSVDAGGK